MSRIAALEETGITIQWKPDEDDGFLRRQRNAFDTFLGDKTAPVTIRFTGQARHYVQERQWHPSQKLEEDGPDAILFTVNVAEPQEVIRWSKQFGQEAQVVETPDEE